MSADCALSSLDFARVRDSGFTVHAPLTSSGHAIARIRVYGITKQQPSFRFIPCVDKDRDAVDYFPYIAEDGQMRLWDVVEDKDLAVRTPKGTRTSWSPEEVRRRLPNVFTLAKSEGCWPDL